MPEDYRKRAVFDEIYASYINGVLSQMVEQMDDLGMYEMPDLISYVCDDLGDADAMRAMITAYFRIKGR